jgi:Heme/copper-type cytochrome/quinol oxidases, subunit 2
METLLARFMPPDASAHGPQLDHLTALVHWLMAILFVGWLAYFVVVLFRFRAGRNPRASYSGAKRNFSAYAEAGVVAFEAILLIGFAIPAWSRWVTPVPRGANPSEIRVVAEQFAWNIHYPGPDGVFGRTTPELVSASNPLGLDRSDPFARDDITTINELHLEVNRPVNIRLSSKDVVHSFNLPVMRVKQDAIPGMGIPVHFTPVRVSGNEKWDIACAQLCGLAHYRMRGSLVVETREELNKWLAAQAPQAQ